MADEQFRVVIVGGGLAAPALALCLAKHDINAAVYELRAEDAVDEGYMALAPNALRILDYIGVYTQISKAGFNYEELYFLNRNLAPIGIVLNGSEERYNFKALRVRRQIVRQALLNEAKARGIKIHYGMKCVGIEQETDDGVTVKFADGLTVSADLVVGADGIHSVVRKHLAPSVEPRFSGLMGVGGVIERRELPASVDDTHIPCFVVGKGNTFAVIPTSFDGSHLGFFATLQQLDRRRDEWAEFARDKAQLSRMMKERHGEGEWPALVSSICQACPESALVSWPFFEVPPLESYLSTLGRVVVIGDAAHAMPPTGGQGAAMAFEDAATLAYVLSRGETFSHKRSSLKRWESHRMARIKRVLEFTKRGGDMRKSSPSEVQQTIKEWLMWAYFSYVGPTGNAQWVYQYRAEDVIGALGLSCPYELLLHGNSSPGAP